MAEQRDEYPNLIVDKIEMSAQNTLTFEEINVGLNIFDKAGIVIERIEYEPLAATWEEMTTSSDDLYVALTNSDNLTTLNSDQAEVIDVIHYHRFDFGTAATGTIRPTIKTRDFSTLGGNGLLVPPKPLYWAMHTAGLASAGSAYCRMYFRIIRLSDAQYLELLETRRAFG